MKSKVEKVISKSPSLLSELGLAMCDFLKLLVGGIVVGCCLFTIHTLYEGPQPSASRLSCEHSTRRTASNSILVSRLRSRLRPAPRVTPMLALTWQPPETEKESR